MAYSGSSSGYGDLSFLRAEGREPGARRKKIGGYLKAANELRQSYFDPGGRNLGSRDLSDDSGTEGPGAFPDAAIVRSGNEEMMLFPSYARKHVKRQTRPPPVAAEMSEQEYWQREWNRHQDDKAIVDVDVNGWVYTPHRGPTTRKNRLMLGVVRQLAGLPPAPTSATTDPARLGEASSRASSPHPTWQDEETIAREAEHIARKGEKEQRYARRGAFSEAASRDTDADSVYSYTSGVSSRDPSPDRTSHRLSQVSVESAKSTDSDPGIRPLQKQSSWRDPTKMTSAELATANTHLFNRLKPFMATPTPNAPVSAFFYNENTSRQHTVYTNAAGHFTCRAALDFVPTHVRVLAAEKLSATEEVTITAPKGVSLISDIDDTIKHSGISVNAREIFRNTFIRELHDLTIDGVREWYNTLHDMGVKMHYVSNSPWQLYPVLTTYFKLAHLPRGSFHLKQYSGMLQGIFEPVAERKKVNLEKIMRDFSDRKFILVGDSGEADLEVYTDIAVENPGRVLGIFIRDVTTPVKTGYFDFSNGSSGNALNGRGTSQRQSADSHATPLATPRPSESSREDADLNAAIAASLADMEGSADHQHSRRNAIRPSLPPRRSTSRLITDSLSPDQPEEDLIDLSDQPVQSHLKLALPTREDSLTVKSDDAAQSKASPTPPPKPRNLRSPSPSGQPADRTANGPSKPPPPPRPRKPSSAVQTPAVQQFRSQANQPIQPSTKASNYPSPLSQVTLQSPELKPRPALPARPKLYTALTGTFSGAHKSPISAHWKSDLATGQPRPSTPNPSRVSPHALSTFSTRSADNLRSSSVAVAKTAPPPSPLRARNATWNTSATTTRKASGRASGNLSDAEDTTLPGTPAEAGVGKKEFLWNQRWARAKRVLESNGVTLNSWRVGSDVAHICVGLVEQAFNDMEKENG